jgi:hypothetical protein
MDGYRDQDGCPDFDNDVDKILDVAEVEKAAESLKESTFRSKANLKLLAKEELNALVDADDLIADKSGLIEEKKAFEGKDRRRSRSYGVKQDAAKRPDSAPASRTQAFEQDERAQSGESANIVLDGRTFRSLVESPDALSRSGRIVPMKNKEGYKIYGVRRQSLLSQLGVRSGDVLKEINGVRLQSGQHAMALYGQLKQRNSIEIEVERRGQRHRWTVTRGPEPVDPWQVADDTWLQRPQLLQKPQKTLPRMFYFENTYLGRTAAFQERLRRLTSVLGSQRMAARNTLPPQKLDPPSDAGLSVTTSLDRTQLNAPGRVILQVALQGSHRYGWRRPPLDMAVVLDPGAVARSPEQVRQALDHLMTSLGPKDRLGVVLGTNPPLQLFELQDVRSARQALEQFKGRWKTDGADVALGMRLAGAMLLTASVKQARVPGSQTLLVLTQNSPQHAAAATVAHELTVQGAVTSVIDLGRDWQWWSVANAGHGQLYAGQSVTAAVDAELERVSKVVARLLRVNIKLADGVEAVRVLGSRMLADDEVKAVKAREVATDLQISKTMGVKANRGDDDDGIQTVIPFFYGGDAHVILVELWVDPPRRGMPVAEVTLKYKDMVALSNATARSQVSLSSLPQATTPAELLVRRNVRGFELAESLGKASVMVGRGELARARTILNQAVAAGGADQALLADLRALIDRGLDASVKQAALAFAGQRRISHVAAARPD